MKDLGGGSLSMAQVRRLQPERRRHIPCAYIYGCQASPEFLLPCSTDWKTMPSTKAPASRNKPENWPADKVETLILYVQSCSFIYDKKDREYKNNNKRDATWVQLSQLLGYSADECKKKWQTLRDQFTRIIPEQTKTSGAPAPAKKDPWAYFTLLEFLKPHITPNPRKAYDEARAAGQPVAADAVEMALSVAEGVILDAAFSQGGSQQLEAADFMSHWDPVDEESELVSGTVAEDQDGNMLNSAGEPGTAHVIDDDDDLLSQVPQSMLVQKAAKLAEKVLLFKVPPRLTEEKGAKRRRLDLNKVVAPSAVCNSRSRVRGPRGPVPKSEQGGAVRWRRLPCIAQLRDKGTSPGPVSCREDGLCATLAAPADRWAAAGVVPLAVLQMQGQGSPCDTL
ncbi:uncharacterized protein LOC144177967 [Haemaphysalis longicornis]